MAVSQPVLDITMIAGASLASSQYRAVKLDTTARQVVICGAADRPFGVLQNAPASGEAATVRLLGTTKIVANGAFALGDILAVAAADGEVDTATGSSAYELGQALAAAGAAGDIVEMVLDLNASVVDLSDLTSVADGDSGADLVGATPIALTGAAANVQAILEALVTALAAVADGTAGADAIGATPITQTGAAATVQAILEALVAAIIAETDSAAGADLVGATPIATLGDGLADTVQEILEALHSNKVASSILMIPISALANVANNDLLLNAYTPGFAGKIGKLSFIAGQTPASTGGKDIDLTCLIGATPTTGGLLTLLTADIDATGDVKDATAITADNAFGAADTISVKCVEETAAFAEGEGFLVIRLDPA
jgi:hypothetical protein